MITPMLRRCATDRRTEQALSIGSRETPDLIEYKLRPAWPESVSWESVLQSVRELGGGVPALRVVFFPTATPVVRPL